VGGESQRLHQGLEVISSTTQVLKSLDVEPRRAIVVRAGVDSPLGELEWLSRFIELETA